MHKKTRKNKTSREPQGRKPIMIAIGGMSGSGKSSLAAALVRELDGAVVIDSDVIRKEMHGVDPHVPLPQSAYTPDQNAVFIEYLRGRQAAEMKKHAIVIVTGTFDDENSRVSQKKFAQDQGAAFVSLRLKAPLATLFLRVTGRRLGDSASDADQKVLMRQLMRAANMSFRPARAEWPQINASNEPSKVLEEAKGYILSEIAAIRRMEASPGTPAGSRKGPHTK